jgi:hypothetical protein
MSALMNQALRMFVKYQVFVQMPNATEKDPFGLFSRHMVSVFTVQ